MVLQNIYVHLDGISNAATTVGVNITDFSHSVIKQPQNLLLLDPTATEGEYDPHTGLKVIRGEMSTQQFLTLPDRKQEMNKWIDFSDYDMLQQLTDLEISELLFFGHMRKQLHSPFFYKLQNNFAYFDMGNHMTKTYYRYISECYRVIGNKVSNNLMVKLNEKVRFFRKPMPVSPIDETVMKKLQDVMHVGIVFSFQQKELINKEYSIAIYAIEDNLKKIKKNDFKNEEHVGNLIYNTAKRTWHAEIFVDDWIL